MAKQLLYKMLRWCSDSDELMLCVDDGSDGSTAMIAVVGSSGADNISCVSQRLMAVSGLQSSSLDFDGLDVELKSMLLIGCVCVMMVLVLLLLCHKRSYRMVVGEPFSGLARSLASDAFDL